MLSGVNICDINENAKKVEHIFRYISLFLCDPLHELPTEKLEFNNDGFFYLNYYYILKRNFLVLTFWVSSKSMLQKILKEGPT